MRMGEAGAPGDLDIGYTLYQGWGLAPGAGSTVFGETSETPSAY